MKPVFSILLSCFLSLFPLFSQSTAALKDKGLKMAIKMADSEIRHFPDPCLVDYNPAPIWNYTQGLIAQSMLLLWKETGNKMYFGYARAYADRLIDSSGMVKEYKLNEHNIDCLNSGKFLFPLLADTKDARYEKVIHFLRAQIDVQPRTSEGGFWHKQRYPNQMWLDGLYMGTPFYAQYASVFNEPKAFDDVVNQFLIVHKHTFNPEKGLNYHGWDESKQQKWADPETGCSPNFWGRAMGWYIMALVDVLEILPTDHPGRVELLGILKQTSAGLKKYQDQSTGLWYQVLDQGAREGNYLESTASCMYTYAFLKASRLGYLGKEYRAIGLKAYEGILKNFIKTNEDSTISLTKCCAVAGLGGNPYRDGSFEYYCKEAVRDNDPKGVGPFIMASLEIANQ